VRGHLDAARRNNAIGSGAQIVRHGSWCKHDGPEVHDPEVCVLVLVGNPMAR
jgi:hypothetical protein